jgi:hypothetical protein
LFEEAIHQACLNGRENENNSKPTRGILIFPLLAIVFMLLQQWEKGCRSKATAILLNKLPS